MSLSTYSGLKTAVANLLNRTDLTAYIPDWITMAEAEFNRRLTSRNMVVTETITITGQTYAIPTDFLEVEAFWLDQDTGQPLEYVTMDQYDNITSNSGAPGYYTISGGYFYFGPWNTGPFTARLRYKKRITALSDTDTSNWVLAAHPDLYLYGAAVHSAPFLTDDARIVMWQGKHDALLDAINTQERRQLQGSRLQTSSGLCDRAPITSGQGTWR